MRTIHQRSRWAAVAALSLLTAVGCRVQNPVGIQSGAAGNGAVAVAGAPAMSGTKPTATAGATATAMNAATAAAGTSASAAGKSTTPSATAGGAGTGGSDAQANSASASGASAAGSSGGAPVKPKNPNAIPACEGKNNEGACDGAKLYYCIDEAPDGAGQSCMSAAMCQVGIKTGKCGECEPGKFKCMGAELQKCDDTGQWKLDQTCPSEALCKETKGICDKSICTEGEYKCSDNSELQICNKDLTGFMTEKPCMKGLCDAMGKKCNECDPMVDKVCESESSLTLCSKDGVKMQMSCPSNKKHCVADKKECFECTTDADCGMSMNECGTRACRDNTCVDGAAKPRGTKCSTALVGGSGVCNFTGTCVACVTDADCNNPELTCIAETTCSPRNAIQASPLLTSYTVTIGAGWSVDVSGAMPTILQGFAPAGNKLGNKTQTLDYTMSIPGKDPCDLIQISAGLPVSLRFGSQANLSMGIPSCNDTTLTVTTTLTPSRF